MGPLIFGNPQIVIVMIRIGGPKGMQDKGLWGYLDTVQNF